MNTDTFSSLKKLMASLEADAQDNPQAVYEVRSQCEKILDLIQHLQFSDNSAHVQLATKHALQYLNQALQEIEIYVKGGTPAARGNLMHICGPAHACLEIILNLDYRFIQEECLPSSGAVHRMV